jgi:hypothetical protein
MTLLDTKTPVVAPVSPHVAALLGAGTLLRLFAYFKDRSMWFDEAMLAHNIVTRPFARLLEPLDYAQGAPIGYLALVKSAAMTGGANEFALRAVSVAASILMLGVMAVAIRHYLFGSERAVAAALLALCPAFIYFAGETKQYSTDALVGAALLVAALRFREAPTTARAATLAVGGLAAMWLSHPAIFVLAPIVLLIAFDIWRKRYVVRTSTAALVTIVWFIGFAVLYAISLRELSRNDALLNFWSDSFAPRSLVRFPLWLWSRYWMMFGDSFGDVAGYFVAWLFVVGCAAMWTTRRDLVWLAAGPLLFALLASVLRVYPFGGASNDGVDASRFTVFALPAVILCCAAGWHSLSRSTSSFVAATLAVVIFAPMARESIKQTRGDQEQMRPLIERLGREAKPGDHVYLYSNAEPAFSFYANDLGYLSRLQLQVTPGTVESLDPAAFERDLPPPGKDGRLWIVYSHGSHRRLSDEDVLVAIARTHGIELENVEANGASLRLFRMTR